MQKVESDIRSLRFALLQVRNPGDEARAAEHKSFVDRLAVERDRIVSVDVLERDLGPATLEGVDCVLVGGSGEYSVLDDHPAIHGLIDFLSDLSTRDVPLFASCFGCQALTVGLGGEVIHDEDHSEVGSYDMSLTDEGAGDPLFAELPRTFVAQLGHKDRISRLPDGVVPLARSAQAPYQAFRIPGKALYATQFHPELDRRDNMIRFMGYMAIYAKLYGEKEAQAHLESHRESPEANALLRRFVEMFL